MIRKNRQNHDGMLVVPLVGPPQPLLCSNNTRLHSNENSFYWEKLGDMTR